MMVGLKFVPLTKSQHSYELLFDQTSEFDENSKIMAYEVVETSECDINYKDAAIARLCNYIFSSFRDADKMYRDCLG